jgi:hypothetical protein
MQTKHIFISPAELDAPPIFGWESLQTNIRVERLPEETDEELKSRAVAADDEARRNGAAAGWPIRAGATNLFYTPPRDSP